MGKHASSSQVRQVWLVRAALGLGAALAVSTAFGVAGASTPSPHTPPPLRAKAPAAHTAALASNVHCGQTVTASLTLNGDLYCPGGTALTVGGSNVVLNLNGHILGGSGTGTAIVVNGKSDTVENGLISEFILGMDITGTADTVSAVRITYQTGTGLVDEGIGTKLTNNFIAFSGTDGIVSIGSNAVYTGNHVVNSGNNGMIFEGFNASVTGTVSNGNDGAGINDLGSGTKLTKNTTNYNGYDGIYSYDARLVDGGGNTASYNAPHAGATRAVQCLGVVCS